MILFAIIIVTPNALGANLYANSRAILGFTAEKEELWRIGLNALGDGHFKSAFQNWIQAAEPWHPQGKGYYLAQAGLSVLYKHGLGVERDDTIATDFWNLANEDRSSFGQQNSLNRSIGLIYAILGDIYLEGRSGVSPSDELAWTYFMSGSSHGNAHSNYKIGTMYDLGIGIGSPSFSDAFSYYRKAAFAGIPDAQHALGEMYKRGVGVPQNYQRSYLWYSIAAATHNGEASSVSRMERDAMAQLLSQDALAKAQDLAIECIETDFENCN